LAGKQQSIWMNESYRVLEEGKWRPQTRDFVRNVQSCSCRVQLHPQSNAPKPANKRIGQDSGPPRAGLDTPAFEKSDVFSSLFPKIFLAACFS